MRLGTLARKIGITPSKLISYLESEGADLSAGTNTKLTEDLISSVLSYFDATLEEETETSEVTIDLPKEESKQNTTVEQAEQTEQVEVPSTSVEQDSESMIIPKAEQPGKEESTTESETELDKAEKKDSNVSESFFEIALPHELAEPSESKEITHSTEESVEPSAEVQDDTIESSKENEDSADTMIDPDIESSVERAAYDKNIEVIKPPKVKLPGLTVKGKIDLPEPKTPVIEEESQPEEKPYNPDEIITTTGPKRERRKRPHKGKGRKRDKDYNPIEAARKRKEREDKKRQEREEQRRKQAKAAHYQKTVASVSSSGPTRKKEKKVSEQKAVKRQEQPVTGNVLQRFWRWMNT